MSVERRTVLVLVVSAILRLLVFTAFPAVPKFLAARVEVSTPISSYKRLQEGIFLHQRGLSPYDGGVFHQAPLLLALFETLPSEAIFICLDTLNALALKTVAEKATFSSSRSERLDGTILAALYLFNPFTLISCLGKSTNVLTNTAITQAIVNAVAGKGPHCMLALALGTYLSLYPALLMPPLLLLCWHSSRKADPSTCLAFILRHIFFFIASLSALALTTPLILPKPWTFLNATYGVQITVPDLTPNVGLWWYFFIEIFDAFRDFFIGVFWLLLVSYVGSLTVRLQNQPLFVTVTLMGLFAIFKPYPSVSDVSLYLGFLPLFQHVFPCKAGLFSFLA